MSTALTALIWIACVIGAMYVFANVIAFILVAYVFGAASRKVNKPDVSIAPAGRTSCPPAEGTFKPIFTPAPPPKH